METIIGTIIGGIIAGLAMILNSYFNSKISHEKEERDLKRKNFEVYISALEKIYEDVLHLADKLIRGKGRASNDELESFYKLEIQLRLKSNENIYNGFKRLKAEIANMAQSLPDLPEEFIPQFEDDNHRRERLRKRKETEKIRDEESKKYMNKLYQMHKELSDDMKNHLAEKNESLTFEKAEKKNA
jgi:hypothetical protein